MGKKLENAQLFPEKLTPLPIQKVTNVKMCVILSKIKKENRDLLDNYCVPGMSHTCAH